jgi:hypothetical protein
MTHEFAIQTVGKEDVVMFCHKCGLSYLLVKNIGGGNWKAMDFIDTHLERTDAPNQICVDKNDWGTTR